jgi:hypothetical protein
MFKNFINVIRKVRSFFEEFATSSHYATLDTTYTESNETSKVTEVTENYEQSTAPGEAGSYVDPETGNEYYLNSPDGMNWFVLDSNSRNAISEEEAISRGWVKVAEPIETLVSREVVTSEHQHNYNEEDRMNDKEFKIEILESDEDKKSKIEMSYELEKLSSVKENSEANLREKSFYYFADDNYENYLRGETITQTSSYAQTEFQGVFETTNGHEEKVINGREYEFYIDNFGCFETTREFETHSNSYFYRVYGDNFYFEYGNESSTIETRENFEENECFSTMNTITNYFSYCDENYSVQKSWTTSSSESYEIYETENIF